ncbi:MAG: metallophosphoesterase, partial [Bacteroidetes bacterium]|nr:metallophosphoesterase [Bacteroidota bacterium]
MSNVLARFIQISDLHILTADERRKRSKPVSGRDFDEPTTAFHVGSSPAVCSKLADFVNERTVGATVPTYVIVTGDLTNTGSEQELRLAEDYLNGKASFGDHPPIGLEGAEWRDLTVPGNHDAWGGHRWPSVGGGGLVPPTV